LSGPHQADEYGLGDFRGCVWKFHLPQSRGVNQVRVPVNDFGECSFHAAFGVVPEKLRIGF
jgi:hypothetical protein